MGLRRLLVAVELALAFVLLTGAGLMIKSFWRMNSRPPGFVPERILALQTPLSEPRYQAVEPQRRFVEEMLDRIEQLPSVQAATVLTQVELYGSGTAPHNGALNFTTWDQVKHLSQVTFCAVSSGFNRVMGLHLVRGSWLMEHEAAPAIVINESMAHELFGEGNAVGKQLGLGINVDDPATPASIVGVVGDLKYSRLDAPTEPEVYIPYQLSSSLLGMRVMVRTAADATAMAPAIRKAISSPTTR